MRSGDRVKVIRAITADRFLHREVSPRRQVVMARFRTGDEGKIVEGPTENQDMVWVKMDRAIAPPVAVFRKCLSVIP